MTYIPGTFTFPPIQIFGIPMITENQIKINKKIQELKQDCIKYQFCPICNNALYNDGSYCYECLFVIDYDGFSFNMDGIVYHTNSHLIKTFNPKNKITIINIEDIITDIDNLTLIKLYNNLTKYITFQ